MIDSTDTCPTLECCPNNPFGYITPPATPVSLSLNNSVTCSTCYNEAYENRITATGLGLQLTWTITEGELPPGLTFHGGYNELGYVIIDGTPTTAGHYEITVQAEAPNGTIGTGTFSLNVVQITTTSLPDYVIGEQYYAQLEADGGSGNYGWGIASGELPDGLILDPTTGVIYGTPTGLDPGVSPIEFQVFDITCEQFNPVFTPLVSLSASSVTYVSTVLGYDEFIASTPPKRYHTATWSGHSEQQLWVGGTGGPYVPADPTQIGGARYDYSGFDHIDTNGTVDSTHVKVYSVECNGDPGRLYGEIQGNDIRSGVSIWYNFRGYYGLPGGTAPNFLGHPTVLCSSPSIPYSSVGDVAVNGINGVRDQSDLWGSALITNSANLGRSRFLAIDNTTGTSFESGTDGRLVMRYLPLAGVGGSGILPLDFWIGGNIVYDNDYSCVLSDEYTDAEALSHAQISNGNSRTAENFPRTTGFVNRSTTVNYGLTCTNLVIGTSYVVTWKFIDLTDGTSTSQSETFSADAATHVINHNIPQPAAGHTLTVTNPTIAFA